MKCHQFWFALISYILGFLTPEHNSLHFQHMFALHFLISSALLIIIAHYRRPPDFGLILQASSLNDSSRQDRKGIRASTSRG